MVVMMLRLLLLLLLLMVLLVLLVDGLWGRQDVDVVLQLLREGLQAGLDALNAGLYMVHTHLILVAVLALLHPVDHSLAVPLLLRPMPSRGFWCFW